MKCCRILWVERRARGKNLGIRIQRQSYIDIGCRQGFRGQVVKRDIHDIANGVAIPISLPALNNQTGAIDQVIILIQQECTCARIQNLSAGWVPQGKQPLAIDGHVGGRTGVLNGALGLIPGNGANPHTIANLIGNIGSCHINGLGQRVRKIHILALVAQCVDVCDIIADDPNRLAKRSQPA